MIVCIALSIPRTFHEDTMRPITYGAAALLLAIAAGNAAAQNPPGPRGRGGRGGRGGPPGAQCMQSADSLTDVQKAQVRALADAFTKTYSAQLDSMRTIMEAARAAREAGKSPDEVRSIMELSKPINDRLAPARMEFRDATEKLLTASQIAAGCIPPAPGGPPPGGRRGGPPPGPPPM
jgi:Spy/CpxP family protein refolding chaperone